MTKRTFAAYSVMLVLAAGAASCESDAPKETAALTSQRSNGESRGDPKVESDQEDAVMVHPTGDPAREDVERPVPAVEPQPAAASGAATAAPSEIASRPARAMNAARPSGGGTPTKKKPAAPPPSDAAKPSPSERARARELELEIAKGKDKERRSDDRRLPLVPRHEADDRFAELRVLDQSGVRDMVFYDYGVNPTIATAEEPVSTFAVDVDSASYNLARSYLNRGSLPDERAIRVEEMINAFDYAYAAPKTEAFVVQAEAFPSPNRKGYHVLHIGLKGRELGMDERQPAALTFVVDVSGSMEGEERLGLVKRSLAMLTRQLDGRDLVGLVVYGSDARVVLDPTRATQEGKRRIIDAISGLQVEGSTNVEAGLDLGYRLAARHAAPGTTSRVVLCSDGVANVGATAAESILGRVKAHADRGVTISTVGFGMGNYNDVLMEQLADKGNGNYAYVDDLDAAQRVFVEQLGATLEVIAKDVKIQVAFDKNRVSRYRLLGFENRLLDKRDFSNDRVDAGEIGAGHTVTAIYELKLNPDGAGELGTLRVRYKAPGADRSELVERAMPVSIVRQAYGDASAPTRLSMVVAAFAEKLRGSYWARNVSYQDILALWQDLPASLRLRQDVAELERLITTASRLDHRGDRFERLLPLAKMDFDRVPVLY